MEPKVSKFFVPTTNSCSANFLSYRSHALFMGIYSVSTRALLHLLFYALIRSVGLFRSSDVLSLKRFLINGSWWKCILFFTTFLPARKKVENSIPIMSLVLCIGLSFIP